MDDCELVRRIAAKDKKAFDELVDKYGGLIKSAAYYHLGSINMYYDEAINDTLLCIWNNIGKYDSSKSSLKNYIAVIVKYRCINYKRKYYREHTAETITDDIPCGSGIDANLLLEEIERETNSLLETLSPADREIFYRHYIQGESACNIAVSLGRTPSYLYNRLSRGRKKLRAVLKRSD